MRKKWATEREGALTNLIDHRHLNREPKKQPALHYRRARRHLLTQPNTKGCRHRRRPWRWGWLQHRRVIRRGAGVVRGCGGVCPRRQDLLAYLVVHGEGGGAWLDGEGGEEEEEGG